MIKKVAAIILVLTMIFTLTGCDVPNIFSYWDGMTKSQAKEYICQELEEKYGEEFEVVSMGIRSGQYYKEIVGTCSPKSDETIAFDFEVNHFSENRQLRDNYIPNVVRKRLKESIDKVLSEHYDNFASEVYVTPQISFYDSGIRSASEATVKAFSESFNQADEGKDYRTSVWIVLSNKEYVDIDKLKNAIEEMSLDFYSLKVHIDCFYGDQETINICNEKANEITTNHFEVMDITYNSDFRRERFIYHGDKRELVYVTLN